MGKFIDLDMDKLKLLPPPKTELETIAILKQLVKTASKLELLND